MTSVNEIPDPHTSETSSIDFAVGQTVIVRQLLCEVPPEGSTIAYGAVLKQTNEHCGVIKDVPENDAEYPTLQTYLIERPGRSDLIVPTRTISTSEYIAGEKQRTPRVLRYIIEAAEQ